MELAVSEYFTVGNIFLAIVFLLILNQLVELYQFRNMPGPRLTSLPFVENLLSFVTDRFVCTKNHSIFIFSRNLLRIRSWDWFLPVILFEYDDSLYRILVKSWLYWYNRKLLSLHFHMPHRRVLNKPSKFACYVSSPQQCALRKIESSNRRMREVELKSTTIEQNKIFSSRRLLYCTGLGNDISLCKCSQFKTPAIETLDCILGHTHNRD